jgi:hypothetical protein
LTELGIEVSPMKFFMINIMQPLYSNTSAL